MAQSTIHQWSELREIVSAAIGRPVAPRTKYSQKKLTKAALDAATGSRLEDKLLVQIEEAIHYLKAQGKEVTQAAICRLTRKSRSALMKHSRLRALMHEVAQEVRNPERTRRRRAEREAELERQVAEYISQLFKEGNTPTQLAIATHIGMTVSALRKYLSVRKLLDNLVELRHHKRDTLEN
jgi:hypothetical protein